MSEKHFIYGNGSLGKEVQTFLKDNNDKINYQFVDDKNFKSLSLKKFVRIKNKKKYLTIALMDPKVRKNIYSKVKGKTSFFNVIHKSSLIFSKLGKGSIIYPFVTIFNNTKIGDFFLANLYSFVGHDCKIGKFVTLGPHAKCCGNVEIKDNVILGANSTILQGIKKKFLLEKIL